MIIRDAVEADLPAIVEIYNEAIRGRISTAQLEEVSVEQRLPWFQEHSATTHPLWVAEIDGQIAGWFSFHSYVARAGYRATTEISVYVSGRFRRRGVGQALLERRWPILRICRSARSSAASTRTTNRVSGYFSDRVLNAGDFFRASPASTASNVTS